MLVQEEQFVQAPLPAVDLLFVVDGTASMDTELDILIGGVDQLLATLDSLHLDWQIGVVSADVEGAWGGWLLGQPYVITPSLPNPVQAFAERLPRGSTAGEAGIAAALFALEESASDGVNAGFRRQGARLQVVFVSDADDASEPWVADPLAAIVERLGEEGEEVASATALVGDLPSGCTSSDGAAQAGRRYHAVVEATGGAAGSICEVAFDELFEGLGEDSVVLPDRFELRAAPGLGTTSVRVDGREESGFRIEGRTLIFDAPPVAGAVVVVRYLFREDSG